jgi:hypothetical protein
VDEAANSAQSMYTEADNLSQAISVFKLSEHDDTAGTSLRALGLNR